MPATIAEQLRASYAEILGIEPNSITNDSTVPSLGGDSLDDIEVLMDVEAEMDIVIEDEDWGGVQTPFSERLELVTRLKATRQ